VALAAILLAPASAGAQTVPPAPSSQAATGATAPSNLWFVVGGSWTTLRGDCQTCEEDFPYRHAASGFGDIGYRVTDRMDVGAEIFIVAPNTADGRIRTVHLNAVTQFRPWSSHGFFLKGGAGMAFVKNWVDASGPDPINSKALSVVVGAGWAFNPASRVGLELLATQHAAALGDLQTAEGQISDVLGNFWTLGVGIVFR
jgi:opacity protein-like surface antigen